MTRRVKVYGFNGFATDIPGRQQRIIVAARSLADSRRFLDAASPRVGWPGRDWIEETGNEQELALATAPGDIFAKPLNPSDGRDWVRIA
jgi:hypothetical protein